MATIPGLNVSTLKHFQANELEDLHNLLSSMELSNTRGLMEEIDSTLEYMTKVLLLEGVNQDYDVLPYLRRGSEAIAQLIEDNPDNFQLERVDKAFRQLVDFYTTDVLLNLKGDTQEEQTIFLLRNLKDNSVAREGYTKFYNTALYNAFRFQGNSLIREKDAQGRTVQACYRIPNDLSELKEGALLSKYVAVITSFLPIRDQKNGRALAEIFKEMNVMHPAGIEEAARNMGITTKPVESAEDIKAIILNLMLIMSMNLFSRNETDLKELLDIPFEQLDGVNEIFSLDRFFIYGEDMLNTGFTAAQLNKWWEIYAKEHGRLRRDTQLYGFTPELHDTVAEGRVIEVGEGYAHAEYEHDYLFDSLLKFALEIYNNETTMNANECEILIDKFVELLANTQQSVEIEIDYSKSKLKPAYNILADIRMHVTTLNEVINKAVSSGALDVELCNEVFQICIVFTEILDATDTSLVPQYPAQWYRVPEFLKYNVDNLAMERNMMIYVRETLDQLYESIRGKDDVFTDISFHGSTLDNFITSGRGHMRAAREGTLKYVATVIDEQNKVYYQHPETLAQIKYMKSEIDNIIQTLALRLTYITEYEAMYHSADNTFKFSKNEFVKFLNRIYLEEADDGYIDKGIKYRYGHLEVGVPIAELSTRKAVLNPVKIEHSKNKSTIESTLEDFQKWYIDLEAREFLLECVNSIQQSNIPVW